MPRMTKAGAHLMSRDPVLARIVTPGLPFRLYGRSDLYLDLLESIVSQQLSVKAAATIFRRFVALFPGEYPEPRRLARMSLARLRKAGVSRQKAGYRPTSRSSRCAVTWIATSFTPWTTKTS